jgi:hypothetical protein
LNSYSLAFGILGTGLLTALILWSVPHLRRRKAVRRFRRDLDQVELVSLAWRQSLVEDRPVHDLPTTPTTPENRRHRWHRRDRFDDGGAALV